MVKLAKKKRKGFKKTGVHNLELPKTGVFNMHEAFKKNNLGLSRDAFMLVVALHALSDGKNSMTLHEQEIFLAGKIMMAMIDVDGSINLDEFKGCFKFYDSCLHTLWNAAKIERRKEKKFGDPQFPTVDEMFTCIQELERNGLIDDRCKPIIDRYDLAVYRQQLKAEGYDLDTIIHKD